jgi:hypothetical protein
LVARAHRQAVELPHRALDNDVAIEIKVRHHAPDDGALLIVLLAEVRAAGFHDVESLATTVATPRKWPGLAAPHRPRATHHP